MSASCQKRTYAAQQSEMLRSAGPGHDKLWREGQVASVRYSLLNGGKNFLGLGRVHLAAAASVIPPCSQTVELPANVWRPTCMACCVYKGHPIFGRHRLDDHHRPITFDGMHLATGPK